MTGEIIGTLRGGFIGNLSIIESITAVTTSVEEKCSGCFPKFAMADFGPIGEALPPVNAVNLTTGTAFPPVKVGGLLLLVDKEEGCIFCLIVDFGPMMVALAPVRTEGRVLKTCGLTDMFSCSLNYELVVV